jgi:hypothetical protein
MPACVSSYVVIYCKSDFWSLCHILDEVTDLLFSSPELFRGL